jgi:hypothetical protein
MVTNVAVDAEQTFIGLVVTAMFSSAATSNLCFDVTGLGSNTLK